MVGCGEKAVVWGLMKNIGRKTFEAPLWKFLKNLFTPNPNCASTPGNGSVARRTQTATTAADKPKPKANFIFYFNTIDITYNIMVYFTPLGCLCFLVTSLGDEIVSTALNQNFILKI